MALRSAQWCAELYTVAPRRPTRAALLGRADQPGGQNGGTAEASGGPIDGPGELLAADGGGIEQRQLTVPLRPEGGCRDADETDRLDQPLAGQQRGRPAIDLQSVLGRVAGVAARERAEVGPAQLERHPAGRQRLGAQLAGDALGLASQGLFQAGEIVAVALERLLGPDRLGWRERLDGPIVAAEREREQVGPVRAEPGGEHPRRQRLQLTDRRDPERL